MSKFATKAAANMFCQARYEAAKSNERLSSREGAAEEIGIDRTRLARISLRMLSSLKKINEAKESLLDITADGIISEEEKPELKKIIQTLDEVNETTQNLKNWIERNLE